MLNTFKSIKMFGAMIYLIEVKKGHILVDEYLNSMCLVYFGNSVEVFIFIRNV